MAIKWGSTTVTVVKWGSTTCTAVYWGSTKVFPDEVILYNAANASTLFTVKCCDMGAVGGGGTVSFSSITAEGFNNFSSWYYDSVQNGPSISNSNPYKTFARGSSKIEAARYTLNANNIVIYGINGKRGTDEGYSYTAGGAALFTNSTYNLSGKSKIRITSSSSSTGSVFVCCLTALPTSYTSNFIPNYGFMKISHNSSITYDDLSLPSSGTYYLMIGYAATAYPDCNFNDNITATITKIVIS